MEDKFNLKDVVQEVMIKDSKTRSNDKWLIIQVLRNLGFKIYVDYRDLSSMPSFESITRQRRVIQNDENRLLPTQDVQEARRLAEERTRLTINQSQQTNQITTGQFY